MSDIRKFMNLMESSLMETSETTNLIFIDYGDGEDLAYSFASSDDADIFRTMEEIQLENSRYSDQPAVKPSSHTLDKVVPAGYLSKFKSIFDEELDDEELMDYYFKMVEMLEPYAVPLSELEEGKLDEASSIHGMDTDAVLKSIFDYGMKYGIALRSKNPDDAVRMSKKATDLIKQAVGIIGERLPMKNIPGQLDDSINESMEYHELEQVLWNIYAMGKSGNEPHADHLINELLDKLADRPHGIDEALVETTGVMSVVVHTHDSPYIYTFENSKDANLFHKIMVMAHEQAISDDFGNAFLEHDEMADEIVPSNLMAPFHKIDLNAIDDISEIAFELDDVVGAYASEYEDPMYESFDSNIRNLPIYPTFAAAAADMTKEDLLDVIVDAWRNGYRITPKTLKK